MRQNIFDLGYDIRYETGREGHAFLFRAGTLPLLEFNRLATGQYHNPFQWYIRELCASDNPLNDLLPADWQTMKHRGFKNIQEVRDWLSGITLLVA